MLIGVREGARPVVDGGPPGTISVHEQADAYQREMGRAALERQVLARRRARGLCVCKVRRLKAHDFDAWRAGRVSVHAADCPRSQPWMEAYRPSGQEQARGAASVVAARPSEGRSSASLSRSIPAAPGKIRGG